VRTTAPAASAEKKPVVVSAGGDWNDDPVSSDDDESPKMTDSQQGKRIPDLNRAVEVDAAAQTNPTSMFQKKPEMGALMGRNIALELRVSNTQHANTHMVTLTGRPDDTGQEGDGSDCTEEGGGR
jgi:hypothetical protein